MQKKKCYLCGREREFAAFNKRSANPDGFDNRCRDCVNAYQRSLHAVHYPPKTKEVLPEGQKRCSKCKEVKSTSDFHSAKNTSDKLYPSCKKCQNSKAADVNKIRYAQDPSKQKEAQLKHCYGIGLVDYNRLLESQGGRCAICNSEQCSSGKSFSVDHDHLSGEIRGILCMDCNVSLGKMKDDPNLLRAAALYLEKFAATGLANGEHSS